MHLSPLGQRLVGLITVHLQDAAEAGEMRDGALGRAVGSVDVSHPRRIGPAPGPVIPCIGPKLPRLGAASSGIEHRRGGLIGKQLRRGFQLVEQALMHGTKQEGGAPNPVSQSGSVEADTLTGVDLRLAVQG